MMALADTADVTRGISSRRPLRSKAWPIGMAMTLLDGACLVAKPHEGGRGKMGEESFGRLVQLVGLRMDLSAELVGKTEMAGDDLVGCMLVETVGGIEGTYHYRWEHRID